MAVAHVSLGRVFEQEHKHAAALDAYRQAAELAPDDADVWRQLAEAHAQADDWIAAINCCERRVALQAKNADAHNDLGWAAI